MGCDKTIVKLLLIAFHKNHYCLSEASILIDHYIK